MAAASEAGLRYVTDREPGIRRRRAGKGFVYFGPEGRRLRDAETLERIRRIAIPPAWTEVWITVHPRGHLQAVGRDARGRKQYRYHERWREIRDPGPRLRFRFRGKGGRMRDVELEDRRIARILRRCQEIPGQELFRYRVPCALARGDAPEKPPRGPAKGAGDARESRRVLGLAVPG